MKFTNGHALLIGVGADLATTVNDAKGVAKILTDRERCAYPTEQVALLAQQTDADSTVIFYFSGHGYEVDGGFGKQYFLMPHGYNRSDLINSAIEGKDFVQKLNAIPAQKMLILLDCCHAGGMTDVKGPQFTKAPLPVATIEMLSGGRGRVVIASSRADELSQLNIQDPYSQFTMALVEAFAGYGASKKDGYVRVADLAMYASQVVPARTHDQQHPAFDIIEPSNNFEVAYYAGGDPQPKGLPPEMARKSQDEHHNAADSGSVVAGERSVAIGGDSSGNTIITGDGNKIDQSVHVNTGGGSYNVGDIHTGGGDFVGRDKVTRS